MTPELYREYVEAFNNKNYDKVYDFFKLDVMPYTEGHTIQGMEGIRRFYALFHEYVTECITVTKVVSD